MLKIGDRVRVTVKNSFKEFYFPDFLHNIIGCVYDIDDEHVWFTCQNVNIDGVHYISGPHRYIIHDINFEYI